MTTALDVAKETVRRASQNYVRGGMSYCQQFAGNFWETHFGRGTPNSYASAAAAYRASKIESKNPDTAPPGAYHYFEYGTLGHVGVALGSGLMASGTGRTAGAVMNLGKNVLVHRVATYGLKYLGWSYTNGQRARITGLTDANAQPNQRTVKSSAPANIRSAPARSATRVGEFKAGTVVSFEGFVIGELVDSTEVWFQVAEGQYSWAGGYTSQSTDGLENLTPNPSPAPVEPEPTPVPEPGEPGEIDDGNGGITPPQIPELPEKEEGEMENKSLIARALIWLVATLKRVTTLSELGIAVIRTAVPYGFGVLLTWLAGSFGWLAEIPEEIISEVSIGLVWVIGTLWYFGIRELSKRWPQLEWLLGYPEKPVYGGLTITEQEADLNAKQ